jgi:hypothetical protein
MKINGVGITAKEFAYDGCHKIYLIETEEEKQEALNYEYNILDISKLEETYNKSCPLKFINYWNLDKDGIVHQFEDAIFE